MALDTAVEPHQFAAELPAQKKLQPVVEDPKGDFRGIKLSNETYRSSKDPEALLARRSNAHPAQLSYRAHGHMDNLHDLEGLDL